MAAIIEIKESLQDNAEKIAKYANKLLDCVSNMDESYSQRRHNYRRYDGDDYWRY